MVAVYDKLAIHEVEGARSESSEDDSEKQPVRSEEGLEAEYA